MKEYERQKIKLHDDDALLQAASRSRDIETFKARESSIAISMGSHFKAASAEPVSDASRLLMQPKVRLQTIDGMKEPILPAFWLPSMTPTTKDSGLIKPDTTCKVPLGL